MQRLMPTHTDALRNPLERGLVALMGSSQKTEKIVR